MTRVLMVGATSAICGAVGRRYAERGARMHLIARNVAHLRTLAEDYATRGASAVSITVLDLTDLDRVPGAVADAERKLGTFDISLICHGMLPDPSRCRVDPLEIKRAIDLNFTSSAVLLEAIADVHERNRAGVIVVLGSVAGDRGRASNYIYGATKSAVETLTEGLRHRLAPFRVRVVLVKPGLVESPMTARIAPSRLMSRPERVAPAIDAASMRGRPTVLYCPWWWRWIMLLIRIIPTRLFNRTRL